MSPPSLSVSWTNAATYVPVPAPSKRNGVPSRVRSYGVRFGLYPSASGSFSAGSVMPNAKRSRMGNRFACAPTFSSWTPICFERARLIPWFSSERFWSTRTGVSFGEE